MKYCIKVALIFLSAFCLTCHAMAAMPLSGIGVTPRPEAALGGAFDGERYLLGLQFDGQSNAVQFVSATTGLPDGAPIAIPGAFGMPPDVAYGSNRFLVVWAGFDGAVHGQLVTTNGLLQGGSFSLSPTNVAAADFGTCRVAFGGGRFLVAWEDTRVSSGGDTDVFGQVVSATGTLLGSNFPISGTDDGDDGNLSIGFDGNNFLVAYSSEVREFMYDGEDVYGRFVSPQSGPLGTPFVIDQNDSPSSNPTTTVFDGERYAVLFHESISLLNAESWQIYARFVSTNGAVVGNRILISGSETVAAQFPSLGWNGSHFLVALREGAPDHWEEGAPESEFGFLDTNAIIRARWYDSAFQPVSTWLEVTGNFGDNEAVLGTMMLPYETGFVLGIQTISTNWIPVNVYGTIIEASLGSMTGDDFNDNSKDLSKWGSDIYFGTNTAAVLSETNNRLEFTKPAGVDSEGVLRPWTQTVGSYTQNWEVAADVYLGDLALPMEYDSWININLIVGRQGDTNMLNAVPIALDLYRDGGTIYRGYEVMPMYNGMEVGEEPNYGYLQTTNLSGRLSLSFNASTKTITAYCNGSPLAQVDVDAVGSDWGMTESDAFVFGIVGSTGSESLGVASGAVWVDNFQAIGTLPAEAQSQFGSVTIWRSLEVNTRALFEVDVEASPGKTITLTVPTEPSTVYDMTEVESAPGGYEYYDTTMTNSLAVLNVKYPQGDYVLRLYSDAGKTTLEEELVVSFGTGEPLPFPEVDPTLTQPIPSGGTVMAVPDQTYLWNAYAGTPGTATHMSLIIDGTGEGDEDVAVYDTVISGICSNTPPTISLGNYDLELSFFFRQNSLTPGGTLVECVNERYARHALTVDNATTTTPVRVFHSWLDSYGLVVGGDYELAASSDKDGDGYLNWQEFVAGTSPTNNASVFKAQIHFENGQPVITWDPDLGANRRYVVEGRSSLSTGNWEEPASESNRFFRVRAELP